MKSTAKLDQLEKVLDFHFKPKYVSHPDTSYTGWQLTRNPGGLIDGLDQDPSLSLGLRDPTPQPWGNSTYHWVSVIAIQETQEPQGTTLEFLEVSDDFRPEFQKAITFCENYGVE